jgi:hypothetical protein
MGAPVAKESSSGGAKESLPLRKNRRVHSCPVQPCPRTQPWKSGPSRAAFQGRQERALARVDVFPATTPQWSLRPSALRLATRPLLENAQAEPRSGERLQPTTQVVGARVAKESSSEGAKESPAQRRLRMIVTIPAAERWHVKARHGSAGARAGKSSSPVGTPPPV